MRVNSAACALVILGYMAAPASAQSFGCTPGSSATDTSAAALVGAWIKKINTPNNSGITPWWSAATATATTTTKGGIDPLTVKTGDVKTSCPSQGGDACFKNLALTTCEYAITQFNLSAYTGLRQVTVSALTIGAFNAKDVATHGAWGPDASLITDGVFAPNGTTWNNPSFAVVLPNGGAGTALEIDLGDQYAVCVSAGCVSIQADKNVYQVEYSLDGTNWIAYGQLPAVSSTGLQTRFVAPTTATAAFGTTGVNARYVRIWGCVPTECTASGDTNFAVSEMVVKSTTGTNLSTSKAAIGPRPSLITDGAAPKDGTTWNDTSYAVVLRDAGPGNALAIDLGGSIALCVSGTGSATTASCTPSIQADKNVYQVDYSLDGTNWVPFGQLPAASDTGLQTRSLNPTDPTTTSVTARYVRIWGCAPTECKASGDTNFSVSEVTLMDPTGANVSKGKVTFGPERVATDGVTPPDGTDWNDPRYTMILSPCLSNAEQKCAQPGTTPPTTGALYIDLTATFPISGMVFQGDRHQFQIDYYDSGAGSWQKLWTVPSQESSSGLITRTTNLAGQQSARYLAIYGTSGDDNNYSVSTVQVFTQAAKTACAYASGADSGQPFACSYDAPLQTQVTVPAPGLSISFNVDSASTYLRCTNGTTTANTTVASIKPGTTCTATLNVTSSPGGGYCSGSCSSGQFIATNVNMATPTFTLTNLMCSNSTGNLTDGLTKTAQQAAQVAVQGLFNSLVYQPQLGPLVPSGSCPTTP